MQKITYKIIVDVYLCLEIGDRATVYVISAIDSIE